MVKRRSNFYGLQLSGMTEITKFTYCKSCQSEDWKAILPFFENNNTFEITDDMVKGIFIDVLQSLEQRHSKRDSLLAPSAIHQPCLIVGKQFLTLY